MSSIAQDPASPEKKKKSPSPLRSIIAGSTAGAIEICKRRHLLLHDWQSNFEAQLLTDCLTICQLSPILPNVRCPYGRATGRVMLRNANWHDGMTDLHSCQDEITAQQAISRGTEAAMAALRQAMVRWLHDPDYWKLGQSWNSYVCRLAHERRDKSADNSPLFRIRCV